MDGSGAIREPRGEAPGGTAPSDLSHLIEVEEAIARMLADAGSEADRILEEARAAERSGEQRQEQEIQQALDAATARIGAEYRRKIEEIAEEARREAERFEAVPPERVAEIAEKVVARVIEWAPRDRNAEGPAGGRT